MEIVLKGNFKMIKHKGLVDTSQLEDKLYKELGNTVILFNEFFDFNSNIDI